MKKDKITPDQMTEDQLRCYKLLCRVFGGEHHLEPIDRWANGISMRTSCNIATFDGSLLTALVVAAHDDCVRVSIQPAMRDLRIALHPRKREGSYSERHPTLEEHLVQMRARP